MSKSKNYEFVSSLPLLKHVTNIIESRANNITRNYIIKEGNVLSPLRNAFIKKFIQLSRVNYFFPRNSIPLISMIYTYKLIENSLQDYFLGRVSFKLFVTYIAFALKAFHHTNEILVIYSKIKTNA